MFASLLTGGAILIVAICIFIWWYYTKDKRALRKLEKSKQ